MSLKMFCITVSYTILVYLTYIHTYRTVMQYIPFLQYILYFKIFNNVISILLIFLTYDVEVLSFPFILYSIYIYIKIKYDI